jgi:hypothetical protein
LDAYLVFLNFANAPDVPEACTADQWQGAKRVVERCLGLPRRHRFSERIATVVIDVGDLRPGGDSRVADRSG